MPKPWLSKQELFTAHRKAHCLPLDKRYQGLKVRDITK